MFINNLGVFFAEVTMKTCSATENMVIERVSNFLKWAPKRKDGGGRKNYFFCIKKSLHVYAWALLKTVHFQGTQFMLLVTPHFVPCILISSF